MAEGSSQEDLIKIRLQAVADMQGALKELESLGKTLEKIQQARGSSPQLSQTVRDYRNVTAEASRMVVQINKVSESKKHIDSLNGSIKNLRKEIDSTAKSQKQIGTNLFGSQSAQNKQWAQYTDGLAKYQYAITAVPKNTAMAVRNVAMFRQGLKDLSVAGIASADSISAINRGKPAFMEALSFSDRLKGSIAAVGTQAEGLSYKLRGVAQNNQWAARQLIMGISLPLAGIATESVRTFGKVSGEMVQLKKVTDFKEDYDAFTKSIRAMSAEFGSSRFAVTSLFRDIAQLGVEGRENIEDYAEKVERLALVGAMSTETAMNFFRTTKALFAESPRLNLKSEQEQIAYTEELLAKFNTVADRTTLRLEDLAESFPEVAPVMEQMGFSAIGVAASLASMHKSGIPATEAAHALKFGLQRIVDPTKRADEFISRMGFSLFDLQGNVTNADLQIMDFAQNLSKLSEEQKLIQIGEIFGKRQAARLSIFINDIEKGRQEIAAFSQGLIKATDIQSAYAKSLVSVDVEKNMDRYQKAVDEIKKDPSTGLKRLRAAFDDIKVQIGSVLAPTFIELGQIITDTVNKFLSLPAGLQKFIAAFLGLTAAIGPLRYFSASLVAISASGLKFASSFMPLRFVSEGTASVLIGQGKKILQVGKVYLHLGGFLQRVKDNYLGVSSSAATNSVATATVAESQAAAATAAQTLAVALNEVAAAYARVSAASTTATASSAKATAAMAADAVKEEAAAVVAAAKEVESKIDVDKTAVKSTKKTKEVAEEAVETVTRKPMKTAADYEAIRAKSALAAAAKRKEAEAEALLHKRLSETVIKVNSLGTPYDAATGRVIKISDAMRHLTDQQKAQVAAQSVLNKTTGTTSIKFNSLGKPYDAATGRLMKMTDAIKFMTEKQKAQILAVMSTSPIAKVNLLTQGIANTRKEAEAFQKVTVKLNKLGIPYDAETGRMISFADALRNMTKEQRDQIFLSKDTTQQTRNKILQYEINKTKEAAIEAGKAVKNYERGSGAGASIAAGIVGAKNRKAAAAARELAEAFGVLSTQQMASSNSAGVVAAAVLASEKAMSKAVKKSAQLTAAAQNIANIKNIFSPFIPKETPAVDPTQQAFVEAMRKRQSDREEMLAKYERDRLAKSSPPPAKPGFFKKMFSGAGEAAGDTKSQFKELGNLLAVFLLAPVKNAGESVISTIKKIGSAAKASKVGGALKTVAVGAKGGEVVGIFGTIGKSFGKLLGNVKILGGPLGTVLSLLLKFNKFTLIISAVVGLIGFVIYLFKGMKTNWEAVMAKIQPGLDAIKAAFNRIKDAVSSVFTRFTEIFDTLGSGANKTGSTMEGIGSAISGVLTGVANLMEWIANTIIFLMPLFESIAYKARNMVGFVVSLFKGDWKNAFKYMLGVVYEFTRPILIVLDAIVKAFAQTISTLLDIAARGAGFVKTITLGIVGGGTQKTLQSMQKTVEQFSDTGFVPMLDETLRSGMGGIFGPSSGATAAGKKDAKESGAAIGGEMGDAINDGLESSAGSGESWVKSWIQKVVGQIDKQLDKLRQSALDALQKAQDAILKSYDDRIKAIRDTEKAEERLLRTEEYLSKRRDLLRQKEINKANYKNNREKAMYEGRYNDVRILDLEFQKSSTDINKQISDLDTERARDLLKEQREALEEQINAEKDAAKERLDIQKKQFEDYLSLLYEMTPVTVEQFQSMMDQINAVLEANGAKWPEYATTAMDRMGEALRAANTEVINEFNRSEANPLLQWVAAFAEPAVVDILKKGLAAATGGGGGATPSGAGTPGEGEPPAPTGPSPEDEARNLVAALYGERGPAVSPDEALKAAREATISRAMEDFKKGLVNGVNVLYDSDVWKEAKDRVGKETAALWGTTATAVLRKEGEQPTSNMGLTPSGAGLSWQGLEEETNKIKQWEEISRSALEQARRELAKYGKTFSTVAINTTTDWSRIFSRSADKIEIIHDEIGMSWVEVNGKMVNTFGETARLQKDEATGVAKLILDKNGQIMSTTVKTYTTSKEVFDDMIKNGIRPGTAEAAEYEKKINDLGGAVAVIDGKAIHIPITLGDWSFWTNLTLIEQALTRMSKKQRAIAAASLAGPYAPGVTITREEGDRVFGRIGSGPEQEFFASGGIVKAQKDGVVARIAEGGYDEYVITTDPKYRAANMGYLAAAASRMGMRMAAGAAISSTTSSTSVFKSSPSAKSEYGGNSGDVYINVDTFIGEEEWFAEMAKKYNMKAVPRERKIAGQQRRVISSYNNRWDVK